MLWVWKLYFWNLLSPLPGTKESIYRVLISLVWAVYTYVADALQCLQVSPNGVIWYYVLCMVTYGYSIYILIMTTWSSLVQAMAWCQRNKNPSPALMMIYSQLNSQDQIQWNFNKISIQQNAYGNAICKIAAILLRPQCVDLVESTDFIMIIPW